MGIDLHFHKYQGTGNDFIMIDGYDQLAPLLTQKQVAALCDRRFGIGADGLIILVKAPGYDFKMLYYNSDGRESTMCGNGGRCAVRFAFHKKWITAKTHFIAIDGPHDAMVHADDLVSLGMKDVAAIHQKEAGLFLDTGSPHLVCFKPEVHSLNVDVEGGQIRNSPEWKREGVNVNFVEVKAGDQLFVRTFERGVEGETYSCGTGVTAAALAHAWHNSPEVTTIGIETPGGTLSVSFTRSDEGFKNILLTGPAKAVFQGQLII
jgi:diaminopimelate epimerase